MKIDETLKDVLEKRKKLSLDDEKILKVALTKEQK